MHRLVFQHMFQAAHLAFGFIHVHGARGGFLLFLAVVAVVALGVIMVVTSDKSK